MKDVAKKYKNSEEWEIKEEMFKIYKQLKEVYRDQAGFNTNGNTFCISTNQLETCMNSILCLYDADENDFLHSSKASVIKASVNVTKVKSPYVFKNEIVRF